MKIFTFCSFKGGTAKTSTALHLGSCLAKFHGKKVLLIDFDSQANLSIGLGVGPDSLSTMVPVLKGECSISDVIKDTSVEGMSLVASNTYLDGIERTAELCSDPYSHELLRRSLKPVENEFDFCFIDTPPSLGWLTQSAFLASHHSVICAIPEAYSILALRRLKDFQQSICKYHAIDVFGIVLSFWDSRGATNVDLLEEIEKSFSKKIFECKVRRDVVVSRSTLKGQTVFQFDPSSRAAEDYKALTNEFVQRLFGWGIKELLLNKKPNPQKVEDVQI